MKRTARNAYIAIGSNVDPEENTLKAVQHFSETRELAAVSTFYRTPPHAGEGPHFVNGVIAVKPRDEDAKTLLARTRELDCAFGRKRGPDKNAPRTIDLDVIAWPGQLHERLPHPDIECYDFVARPLAELDGHVLTRDGRPVIDIARGMIPHGMIPLDTLTRELRALVQHAKRSLHA